MTARNAGTAAAAVIAVLMSAHTLSQSLDPTVYYIPLTGARDTVYSMKESVYRLESAHPSFSVINTASQKLLDSRMRGPARVLLVAAGESQYAAEGEPGENLYDTPFLNLSSDEIRNAAEAITAADDPVAGTELFVKGVIKKPTVGIPLLPARQVLLSGTGDCTEHAVLAVALLRSVKIPARAVVGMILVREFEDKRNIFIYHMWAEAYHRGRWRLVDATSPGEKSLNRYIAFAYHNLRTETPLAYLKAVSAIQDLSVTYVR